MTSCATCAVCRTPYVSGPQLRHALQGPQLLDSKVVEPDGPTAYPPQECHPSLPVAFAWQKNHLLPWGQQLVEGPAFLQKKEPGPEPQLSLPRRYWMVWPGNLPM